jgi:hypothetical protein
MPNQPRWEALDRLVSDIRRQHSSVEVLAANCRTVLRTMEEQEHRPPAQYPARHWSLAVVTDALVRVRLLIEQNLTYLETLGVLALTRYVFELTIWVRLVEKDNRYGLLYYRELVDKQKLSYEDLHSHLVAEVAFLLKTSDKEKELIDTRLNDFAANPDSDAASTLFNDITQKIDAAAARRFTLYGEQARNNGYGFQAFLVETKVIPEVKASLAEVDRELKAVDSAISGDVKKLMRNSNWKQRAAIVGMAAEYDFVYSYTSRLLHATPPSITTDQKNLEPGEIEMFLRYVKVAIMDMLDIATKVLTRVSTPATTNLQ